MLSTHTPTPTVGGFVKRNLESVINWPRRRRAKRAFFESTLVPPEAVAMFGYLKSKQGANSHAFPSAEDMGKRFGSKDRARRWVAITENALPEVFSVERIPQKTGGRHRNSYFCIDFDQWPDELIDRLEAGMIKPRRKFAKVTPIVAYNEARKAELVQRLKTRHQESLADDAKHVTYMGETMEVNSSSVKKRLCESGCGQVARFHYKGRIWICEQHSGCHQEAAEAFVEFQDDFPDF